MTAAVTQLALFGDDTDAATPQPVRRVWRPLQGPLTAKTVTRFWTKVVKSPSCFYFVGALSFPDGYGRNRAELHRFMHSTVRRYLATVHVK